MHLTNGLETQIPKSHAHVKFKNKSCKICGGHDFTIYDELYVACDKCGTIADAVTFQSGGMNKASPIGFNYSHEKPKKRKFKFKNYMKNGKKLKMGYYAKIKNKKSKK